jgi:hypothetical protein
MKRNTKGKIIIGAAESGKSLLSRNMALAFDNPVILDATNFSQHRHFYFESVNQDTDLIVFDNFPVKEIEGLYGMITEGFFVEKQGKPKFFMNPVMIVVNSIAEDKELPTGPSFNRRFTVINTWISRDGNKGNPFFHKEMIN